MSKENKTKEEILKKLGDGFHFDIHFYSNAGRKDLADFIIQYAEIKSRERVISFDKWKHENGWLYNEGYYYQPNEETDFLTPDNAYNLFIQQTENKELNKPLT